MISVIFRVLNYSHNKWNCLVHNINCRDMQAEGPSVELYMVAIASFFGRSWVTYRSDPMVILSCSTRHHILILGRVHHGGTYS